MPRLSDSMEEGTILTWLKQVGDVVAIGDELVEIETDKANMAYEADVAGTLQEILAKEGETLPIGTPIARIGENGAGGSSAEGQSARPAGPAAAGDRPPPATAQGAVPPTTSPTGETAESVSEVQAAPAAAADGERPDGSERIKASPLARRLAEEKGLDLSALHGSGPGGRIVKSDVETAAPPAGDAVGGTAPEEALATGRGGGSPAAAGPAGHAPGPSLETAKGNVETRELNKLQQTITRRRAESKATAPLFYLTIEIDMCKEVEARATLKAAAKEGEM